MYGNHSVSDRWMLCLHVNEFKQQQQQQQSAQNIYTDTENKEVEGSSVPHHYIAPSVLLVVEKE